MLARYSCDLSMLAEIQKNGWPAQSHRGQVRTTTRERRIDILDRAPSGNRRRKRRLRLNGLQYRQTTRPAVEEALRETRQAKMDQAVFTKRTQFKTGEPACRRALSRWLPLNRLAEPNARAAFTLFDELDAGGFYRVGFAKTAASSPLDTSVSQRAWICRSLAEPDAGAASVLIDELDAASTLSASLARCYGMARVARVWKISRASVYRSLKEPPPNTIARRPGPVGACSDAELAEHIRQHIAASRLHGAGCPSYGRGCALLAFARAPVVCDG
jgi:hypothetical protein